MPIELRSPKQLEHRDDNLYRVSRRWLQVAMKLLRAVAQGGDNRTESGLWVVRRYNGNRCRLHCPHGLAIGMARVRGWAVGAAPCLIEVHCSTTRRADCRLDRVAHSRKD